MDRRYLAATLALAATFAIFSREFRSGHLAKFPTSRAQLQADVACVKDYVAERMMAKLGPYLDRNAPEQAQMVAELNLPDLVRVEQKAADAQTLATEESAHQKCEVTLRAQREAMHAQKAGCRGNIPVGFRECLVDVFPFESAERRHGRLQLGGWLRCR